MSNIEVYVERRNSIKTMRWYRVIYTLCFFALCIIDWMAGSMEGRVQFISTNCTGIVIAIIILSGYRLKDFFKPVYVIWTGLVIVSVPLAVLFLMPYYPYKGQFISGMVNICIYGYIVIRVSIRQIYEKKSNVNFIVFFIWIAMLALMLVSRNEAIWPLWFAAMFGSFYLTEYEKGKKILIYKGLIDGVILGFFAIQGAALLFRPYDIVRYMGMYLNCNINALFYLTSFCALLCKLFILIKENKNMVFRVITFFLAGSMFGFTIMTGSRATVLSLIAVFVPFLISGFKYFKKKARTVTVYIVSLILVATISVPVTFMAVRYVPTIHLHPVFFMDEYNNPGKIHSGDPRDSEKYVTFDYMVNYCIGGRLSNIFPQKLSDAIETALPVMQAYAAEAGTPEKEYLIEKAEDLSGFNIRYQIHKWYLKKLNLFGHSNDEHGVPLTSRLIAPHAHNWWLQLTFNFGIPVGILLLCGVALYVKIFFSLLKSGNDFFACIIGCFTTAFLVFGFLEVDYFLGQLPFTLFFLLFALVVQRDHETVKTK